MYLYAYRKVYTSGSYWHGCSAYKKTLFQLLYIFQVIREEWGLKLFPAWKTKLLASIILCHLTITQQRGKSNFIWEVKKEETWGTAVSIFLKALCWLREKRLSASGCSMSLSRGVFSFTFACFSKKKTNCIPLSGIPSPDPDVKWSRKKSLAISTPKFSTK